MQYRSIVLALLACACGPAQSPPPPASPGPQPTAAVEAAPRARSFAPVCGHPGAVIGVCSISDDGVTVQARALTPGALAIVQLDGDYATPPFGCRRRWHQEQTADAGGVVTARFDIPATDRCRLLAAMLVRVYLEPAGDLLGPIRFSTLSPP